MKRKLLIFGTGDLAELAAYLFALHTDYEIAAFCLDAPYVTKDSYQGLPLVSMEEALTRFAPADHHMFVAIGYSDINKLREKKYRDAKTAGYTLATYISPLATTFDNLIIGDNCFVFENNVLQPFVTIGANTILWSGNHVGHHTAIGDHCFIASHAVISGRVTIGNNVFIGVNATLRDKITVGNHCVIGAGALLSKSAQDNQVFIATPTQASPVPSNRLRSI